MSPPTMSSQSTTSDDVAAARFNCSRFGPEKSNYSSRSKTSLMEWRRKQPETTQDESSVKLSSGRNVISDGVKLDGRFRGVFEGPMENSVLSGTGENGHSNGYREKFGYCRSKPRLMKWRRKQTETSQNESSVKLDVAAPEVKVDIKVGGAFEGHAENSVLSGTAENGHSNGCREQFGDLDISGLGFGVDLNECVFNPGTGSSFTFPRDGKSSVALQNGISKLDVQEEHQNFVFTACKNGSGSNQSSQNRDDVFNLNTNGLEKESHFENGQFVFGVNGNNTGSNATFSAKQPSKDSRPSKLDEFQKIDDFGNVEPPIFVFGVNKSASMVKNIDQHYNGNNWDSHEFAKGNAPSMTGKVPCFNFPSIRIDDTRKENFVFSSCRNDYNTGIDLENKARSKSENQSNFSYYGNENVDNEIKFQNVSGDGAFAFGEFESSGATRLVNEKNQLNREEVKDCNEFRERKQSIGSGIGFNHRNGINSGVTSQSYACNLSDEMNRLNINNSNVFVFGSVKASSNSLKQNHMSDNIPDIQLNNACEVPDKCEWEKDVSFTSKHDGFDLPNADYSTPSTNFSFSNLRFDPGIEKGSGITHSKLNSWKRLNRANVKPKRSTLVQDLFGQDHAGIVSSKQTETSPICGSPMDFSPYRDPSAGNVSTSSVGTGTEGEVNVRKEISDDGKSDDNKSNLKADTSLSAQDGLSAIKRQYRKKYKLKVGSNQIVQGNNPEKLDSKQSSQGVTSHEECDNWRIRGNQAYQAGKLSKAEEFYSKGIRSVSNMCTPGYSAKSLLLCYSNRAATRMSLGRMREAIGDCLDAAALDPSFLKVALRAGNCYLILGEIEDATQSYNKCLESGTEVCLDRRVTVDAADGLYKAKSVAEYMSRSAKLLLEGTTDAAGSALENIEDALSISRYSEKLLEMKAEALCILRKYEQAIVLCEQTLHNAKKNFVTDPSDDPNSKNSHMSFWRQHVQSKCHYHLGTLDLALEMIEKQGRMPISSESGDLKKESSIALAASIQELLCLKKSGNEAFKSGKYTEAVEHYTAAISKSVDSRPFMAICFCNRAAAYQSMNQILDAIADCSLAIALDENYQKAISRRATLHETIRDYKQAVNDKQRLISLFESQNASHSGSGGSSVRDIRKAYRHLSTIEEKAKMETPLDLYLILGIKASDTESEIKKAYRKAALRHHPDKAGQVFARSDTGEGGILWKEIGEKIHNDADKLFKVIGEAYAVLSDPSKRSKYDIEEDIRNGKCNYSESSSRNCSSGRPSTSYNSSFGKSSSGRQTGGYGNSRKHWYESRSSYSYDESRWWE